MINGLHQYSTESLIKELEKRDYFDKRIFDLFRLLDNIDTASDIAKGDDKKYRAIVSKEHRKRFDIFNTDQIDEMYGRFY